MAGHGWPWLAMSPANGLAMASNARLWPGIVGHVRTIASQWSAKDPALKDMAAFGIAFLFLAPKVALCIKQQSLPRKNSAQIRKQERTYHPTNGVYMSPAKFICCGHGSSISWLRHRPALGHCAIFSYRTLLLSSLAGHRNGEPAGDVLGTARYGARQMHTLWQTVEPAESVRGPF